MVGPNAINGRQRRLPATTSPEKAVASGEEDSSAGGTPSTTAAIAKRGFRQLMPLDQSGSSRAMEVEHLGINGLFGTRPRAYGSDEEPGRRRRRTSRTICARTRKGARNRSVPLCRRNQKRRRQRISRSCCAGVLPNMRQTYHFLAHWRVTVALPDLFLTWEPLRRICCNRARLIWRGDTVKSARLPVG
jgi:hypothetical protein